MKIPGLTFSLKRAVGVSAAQNSGGALNLCSVRLFFYSSFGDYKKTMYLCKVRKIS